MANREQMVQMIKTARYQAMKEAEWRKLAATSWEALKKEAEMGSHSYEPNDAMVIGVLGEECFDSFKEYKDMKRKHPDSDFIQLASAMISLNKALTDSMNKVASYATGLLNGKPAKMVKTATSQEKRMDSSEVALVVAGAISRFKDGGFTKKASIFMDDVLENKTVGQGKVKKFFSDNKVFEKAGIKKK
jgi:hypothetical protein